jgi:hypothetical protein
LVEWDDVKTHKDLILARMHQLDKRITMEDIAARNQRQFRTQNKTYFDEAAWLRPPDREIHVGDLVLVFRPQMLQKRKSRDLKLDDRWQGPYRVREKTLDSTFYLLEELDGTEMKCKYAGEHVKKYFPRLSHERQAGIYPAPTASDGTGELAHTL